jgi:hypothetical protein
LRDENAVRLHCAPRALFQSPEAQACRTAVPMGSNPASPTSLSGIAG